MKDIYHIFRFNIPLLKFFEAEEETSKIEFSQIHRSLIPVLFPNAKNNFNQIAKIKLF